MKQKIEIFKEIFKTFFNYKNGEIIIITGTKNDLSKTYKKFNF